jgi:pimeloyl-ACP methyl ester carboxylesterase
MASLILVLSILGQPPAALPMAPLEPGLPLWAAGPDRASGSLINCTVGCQPGSPIDPARPTVVVVHGINPFRSWMHLEVAQRYGEAIGERWGMSINVLGWDWNGDSMRSMRPSRNDALAEFQGRALAEALVRAGVAPDRLHLVGHSSGGLAAAAAARSLADNAGDPIDRLTLLDPAEGQHDRIFGALGAGRAARVVYHFWAPGPSGFGRPALYPNVRDQAMAGPAGWRGLIAPDRLDHHNIVRWHIGRLAVDPWSF